MHIRTRSLASLPLLLLLAAAGGSGVVRADSPVCTPGVRQGQLAAAQREVLGLLGGPRDVTVLEDASDLAALGVLGYDFYPHHQTSIGGLGWSVLDTLTPQDPGRGTPVAGRPSLLLYMPSGGAVTGPRDGFDFPYHLAGWAYVFPYDPAQAPTMPGLECLEGRDWFVHERGVHTFDDGGFVPHPPEGDRPRGSASGRDEPCRDPLGQPSLLCSEHPGDFGHARLWDAHVWLAGDGVPTVSILNPGTKIPGIDPGLGQSFFHVGEHD